MFGLWQIYSFRVFSSLRWWEGVISRFSLFRRWFVAVLLFLVFLLLFLVRGGLRCCVYVFGSYPSIVVFKRSISSCAQFFFYFVCVFSVRVCFVVFAF